MKLDELSLSAIPSAWLGDLPLTRWQKCDKSKIKTPERLRNHENKTSHQSVGFKCLYISFKLTSKLLKGFNFQESLFPKKQYILMPQGGYPLYITIKQVAISFLKYL